MPSIYHNLQINSTTENVFAALTQGSLIAQWWLPDVEANPVLHGLNIIGVGSKIRNKMRITQLDAPRYLEWTCENDKDEDEWKNTVLRFRIEPISNAKGVMLHFEHDLWLKQSTFYGQCSFHWARHLTLLKELCETGDSGLTRQNEVFEAEQALQRLKGKADGVINLSDKLSRFNDYWSPKIIAELNGQHVKLAKLKGAFEWHSHADEDELFIVLRGQLTILLRSEAIDLNAGECYLVPKGVEHKPVAEEEVAVMLFEPISTLNTGNVESDRTKHKLDYL